jgi:hypothetical protein
LTDGGPALVSVSSRGSVSTFPCSRRAFSPIGPQAGRLLGNCRNHTKQKLVLQIPYRHGRNKGDIPNFQPTEIRNVPFLNSANGTMTQSQNCIARFDRPCVYCEGPRAPSAAVAGMCNVGNLSRRDALIPCKPRSRRSHFAIDALETRRLLSTYYAYVQVTTPLETGQSLRRHRHVGWNNRHRAGHPSRLGGQQPHLRLPGICVRRVPGG